MTDRIKDFPGKSNIGIRKDSLRAMRTLDVKNSVVISSLTEKWENKKLKTNCEIRLQEVADKIDLIKEIMESNLLISNDFPKVIKDTGIIKQVLLFYFFLNFLSIVVEIILH